MAHLDVLGLQVGALALGAHGHHLPHRQLSRSARFAIHRNRGFRIVMNFKLIHTDAAEAGDDAHHAGSARPAAVACLLACAARAAAIPMTGSAYTRTVCLVGLQPRATHA